jgi:hypothetical protein
MERFDIVFAGFDEAPADPAGAVAETFQIDRERAAKVLASAPVTIKRGVDLETAERYFHRLRAIGAKVQLDKHEATGAASGAGGGSEPEASGPSHEGPGHDGAGHDGPAHDGPGHDEPGNEGLGAMAAAPVAAVAAATASTAPATPAAATAATAATHEPSPAGPYREPHGPELESKVQVPYLPKLLGAFGYPIQPAAPAIFAGVVLTSELVSYLPLLGAPLSAGILIGYLFAVLRQSAAGDDKLPFGTDFIDWNEFMAPVVRYALALGLCLVPTVLAASLIPWSAPAFWPAVVLAVLAGIGYMPAAIIIAAHGQGCLSVFNPVAGVQMIARVPLAYALTSLMVGITVGLDVAATLGVRTATAPLPVPLVPGLLARLVGLYFSMVIFRMLGLFISHHEHELGI